MLLFWRSLERILVFKSWLIPVKAFAQVHLDSARRVPIRGRRLVPLASRSGAADCCKQFALHVRAWGPIFLGENVFRTGLRLARMAFSVINIKSFSSGAKENQVAAIA